MSVQSPVNLVLTTTEAFDSEEMINVRFYINFHLNWKYSYNTIPVRFGQLVINYRRSLKKMHSIGLIVYFYSAKF